MATVLAVGCAERPRDSDPPETRTVQQSYAFDVTDRKQLAGYADHVVIGRVLGGSVASEGTEATTTYQVSVMEALKGDLPGEVSVRQLGGEIGGVEYVLEDQPALEVGQLYVLAVTGAAPGTLTLLAGPHSATLVEPGSLTRMRSRWLRAVDLQRHPDALNQGG